MVRAESSLPGGERSAGTKRAHLVGVAGTGLRGLAGLLVERGYSVSGSEAFTSPALESLGALGVDCRIGHREDNVGDGTSMVLISAAITPDNPEVRRARRLGIPVMKYAEFLGTLMRDRAGIAVAGTHGKTTTTAMVAQSLVECGADPGFIVGGEYPSIGGSSSWGTGPYFVAEACEFDRSFLNLFPAYSIVTNIEEDHLDYFGSLGEIQEAFTTFIEHVDPHGRLVINADDRNSAFLADFSPAPVDTFSMRPGGGDWWAERIRPSGGGVCFEAVSVDARVPLQLKVPGVHNVKNALAVVALMTRLGYSPEAVCAGLEAFTGVKRRFEILLREPVAVIDDYAHHPTEIDMVIRAARETYPGRRLRVVFQPHQYSRTYRFLDGFAEVLADADEVIVTDVFSARDTDEDRRKIDAPALVRAVVENRGNASYSRSFEAVVDVACRTALPRDVFLCLGAGDITYLANRLAKALRDPPVERT